MIRMRASIIAAKPHTPITIESILSNIMLLSFNGAGLNLFIGYIVHCPAVPITPICGFTVAVYDLLNLMGDEYVMHNVRITGKLVM